MVNHKRVLENIHYLIYKDQGQNYVFNGCMQFLMECLGESDEYDYWFFSGVTGDSYVQVYGSSLDRWYQCYSHACFDYELLKRVFDSIGYDFTYVSSREFRKNQEKYIKRIINYIDRGLPVIARGFNAFSEGNLWFVNEVSCIVGYENGGEVLLYLPEDSIEPTRFSLNESFYSLVFVEDKGETPSIGEIYKRAIMNIPKLISKPPRHDCSFGRQAFLDWANAIEDGHYDEIQPEEFDAWRMYKSYVSMLATNVFCREFNRRALGHNPDLVIINRIHRAFDKMQAIYQRLEGMGAGFDISLDMLQNVYTRRLIADVIRRFSRCYDELLDDYMEDKKTTLHPC